MKKIITLALTLALALSLTACGGAKQSGTPTDSQKTGAPANHLEEIKAAGKIVLGTSADYPPYEFHKLENGKDIITGWEIEMAEQIAKDLGVKLEIKEGKFETLIADLNTKKVDFVIAAMTIDEERSKSVDFSTPYWKGGQVILTKKATAGSLKSQADLNGKTLGAQLGSTGEKAAKAVEGTKVKSFDAFEAAVMDLVTGKVDAVVCDYTVARNYEINNKDLTMLFDLTTEDSGIAFRKGDKELVEAVNQSVAKMKQEGAIEKLVAKYQAEAK